MFTGAYNCIAGVWLCLRELKRPYPERAKLESQCISTLALVRGEAEVFDKHNIFSDRTWCTHYPQVLDCPIWLMLINVVALEMLKAKMPQFASRSLRSSHLEMINLIPLTSVHTLLRPVWRKVAKSFADIVASQAPRLVYTAEMTPLLLHIIPPSTIQASSPDDSPLQFFSPC